MKSYQNLFIYLFGVQCRFENYIGHIINNTQIDKNKRSIILNVNEAIKLLNLLKLF